MARTRKDRPVFVKANEKVKQGKVNHDHRPTHSASGWYQALTQDIPKGDTEAVKAFQADLDSKADTHRYTMTEVPPRLLPWDYENGRSGGYTPRMVRFSVERYWSREAHDAECTVRIARKNRDENWMTAKCWPQWAPGDFGSGTYRAPRKPRSQVKQELRNSIADAWDEFLDDVESETD